MAAVNLHDKTFKCFDKSGIIPLERLNDGFKDCKDGSDEPGTSANQNGVFYCENKGYLPKYVNKWSVGDGICDCCDGSDEASNPHAQCENHCDALNSERLRVLSILKEIIKQGLAIKKNVSSTTKVSIAEAKAKVKALRKEQKRIDALVDKINRMVEVNTPDLTIQAENDTQNDSVGDENEIEISESETEQAEDLNLEARSNQEPHEEELQNEDSEMKPNLISERPMTPFWKRFVRSLYEFTFFIPKSISKADKDRKLKQLDAKRSEIQDEILKYQSLSDLDSSTDPAAVALQGQEFTTDTHTLIFLKELKEGHTSLGNYHKMSKRRMKFNGGSWCWQVSKGRKASLDMVCSNETRLVSVVESSTCVYKGTVATPIACENDSDEKLEELDLEQLLQEAEKLGIFIKHI